MHHLPHVPTVIYQHRIEPHVRYFQQNQNTLKTIAITKDSLETQNITKKTHVVFVRATFMKLRNKYETK